MQICVTHKQFFTKEKILNTFAMSQSILVVVVNNYWCHHTNVLLVPKLFSSFPFLFPFLLLGWIVKSYWLHRQETKKPSQSCWHYALINWNPDPHPTPPHPIPSHPRTRWGFPLREPQMQGNPHPSWALFLGGHLAKSQFGVGHMKQNHTNPPHLWGKQMLQIAITSPHFPTLSWGRGGMGSIW